MTTVNTPNTSKVTKVTKVTKITKTSKAIEILTELKEWCYDEHASSMCPVERNEIYEALEVILGKFTHNTNQQTDMSRAEIAQHLREIKQFDVEIPNDLQMKALDRAVEEFSRG